MKLNSMFQTVLACAFVGAILGGYANGHWIIGAVCGAMFGLWYHLDKDAFFTHIREAVAIVKDWIKNP